MDLLRANCGESARSYDTPGPSLSEKLLPKTRAALAFLSLLVVSLSGYVVERSVRNLNPEIRETLATTGRNVSDMANATHASGRMETRLQSPFMAMVVGPTGSGKTVALLDLIRNSSTVSDPPPVEIIYCYGAWQEVFENVPNVRFVEGLLSLEDIENDGLNRWVILDDLMDELSGNSSLTALFTKHSHHRNISVFFVSQNLFHKKLRTVP